MDAFGNEDWMEHLPSDHKTNLKWRKIIGKCIAKKHFGYNTVETQYYMNGLPNGYTLYKHHKTTPGKKKRSDTYLYGSRTEHVFRSPQEFLMHALWLMQGAMPNMCKCKWCTGGHSRSQIAINARYNLPGQQVPPERRIHRSARH
ncbi:Transcription-silencing protein, cryptic loci regulator Clr2 [Ceratobasidium sp. AG-Ba]|nr:Transcription-silencing protein, cryptic loci regulator Clr2 [Ceratobasidium sp. AG-Ba]QRW03324.1 Transcription-silencing protein, cryptic loci regulator Clr2 [Ceratobasidium sp. AG-Ba]